MRNSISLPHGYREKGFVFNVNPHIPRRSRRLSSLRLSQKASGQHAVAVAFPEVLAKIEDAVCTDFDRTGTWAFQQLMVNHPLMYRYFWSSLNEKVEAGNRCVKNKLLWRQFAKFS